MTVFLANRANLQSKRLHDRIQNRLSGEFENVRRRLADPCEAGPYRVVGEVDPRQFLEDDSYTVANGRIEIGFQLQTGEPYEYYWFNWIEQKRSLLVGWHQDETHPDLGAVHLQVNDGTTGRCSQPRDVHRLPSAGCSRAATRLASGGGSRRRVGAGTTGWIRWCVRCW